MDSIIAMSILLHHDIHCISRQVLDHGRIRQFGHPFELLQDKEGWFHKMAQQLGPAHYESLTTAARRQHNMATTKLSIKDTSGPSDEPRGQEVTAPRMTTTRTVEGAVNKAFVKVTRL